MSRIFEKDAPPGQARGTSLDWIRLNAWIGAMSVGGSGRSLMYQRAVVEQRKWISPEEFQEVMTLAQLLPGPNLVNIAAYLGYRLFGVQAAIAGVIALALPGAIGIVFLLAWIPLENTSVSALFRGFSLASCLLFAIFVSKLFRGILGRIASQAALTRTQARIRISLAVMVGIASLSGVRLVPVLICGSVAALLVEFWDRRRW